MKQLHKQSGTNHRKDEDFAVSEASNYIPKTLKHTRSLPRSINYLLKEQRLLFILIGIFIGSTFFIFQPNLHFYSKDPNFNEIHRYQHSHIAKMDQESVISSDNYLVKDVVKKGVSGRIPVGIKRGGMRIVVTGGSGFVGSHLVDKLIARGDHVIVIDNFFTGRKENVMHHFRNPRFELIRHDVVEPILLEVDQIYHLACPASPVHYKYNPIKTIISF
ncbi:decarboxylase [Lithospermum erythrorhizon]|uniref:Decarboxylase n=1 Tax=Lithospermum erythrorhizon TaxID=34254 RepID=A0AAV3QL63_LITER